MVGIGNRGVVVVVVAILRKLTKIENRKNLKKLLCGLACGMCGDPPW